MLLAALILTTLFPTTRVEYAAADGGGGLRIAVHGVETNDGSADFPHRVFVGVTGGPDVEITDRVRSLEPGRFADFKALVNIFTIGRDSFADVVVWSKLSGSGSVSAANDLLFHIVGNKLVFAGELEQSAAFSRSGWNFVRQNRSEIVLAGDALIWNKSIRVASGRDPRQPLKVKCGTARIVYRFANGRFTPTTAPLKKGAERRLPQIESRDIVPCCNGCTIPR